MTKTVLLRYQFSSEQESLPRQLSTEKPYSKEGSVFEPQTSFKDDILMHHNQVLLNTY